MEKDFDRWHGIKKQLDKHTASPQYCKPREIWMCSLGVNIGSEQDGKGTRFSRPVVVFKVLTSNTFLAIPITSQKRHDAHHFKFNLGGIDQFVKLSQVRTLSTKRLERKVVTLPTDLYLALETRFFSFIKNEIPLAGEISEAEANSQLTSKA